jgi:methylenetetrahydrofolate reductase (NADH)
MIMQRTAKSPRKELMHETKLSKPELVDALVQFSSKFTIETTPKESARISSYADHLSRGRQVYIAHIAGTPYNELIQLAARLRREGFEPVMHMTARDMPDKATLSDVLGRYTGEAGGTHVLLIAGDMPSPTGDYADTITILRTGLLEKHGITRIGLAGHPEGNKQIGDARLREALAAKNAYARDSSSEFHLVTQFGFEAEPFIAWERRIREEGLNALKIDIGMPGLASFPTLLRFAVECGAGPSIRALRSRAGNLAKLATVAQPDDLLLGIARSVTMTPQSLISAPHLFPFGGLKKTAEWINAILARRVELNADATGFSVK